MTKEQAHTEILELFARYGAAGEVSQEQVELIHSGLAQILNQILNQPDSQCTDYRFQGSPVHPDWHYHGFNTAVGMDEECWLMDDHDFRIHMFAKVTLAPGAAVTYMGSFRCLIAHLVRNADGQLVGYSYQSWPLTVEEFKNCLAMNHAVIKDHLRNHLDTARNMPT